MSEPERSKIRIAVDGMGGDYAPNNIVAGALDALRETNNRFEVILVGPEQVLKESLANRTSSGLHYTIVNATEIIDMHDSPTDALRKKRDSSITVGITLQNQGKADAFISAGNTGAVMSASTLILGRVAGVGRPTIGAFLPAEKGVCLLVDAGANVDCKPQHLLEFGIMGSIYCQEMLGVERPTVGLLNVGEEDTKGNEIVKEAFKLLKESKLNFIGNVEGKDILQGKALVVVADGFVGNILLKFGESIPRFLKSSILQYAAKNSFRKLTALAMRSSMRQVFKSMDYEEHGGIPVLGVKGISIVGHGKSTPKAIKNMILKAEEMVKKNINQRIQESLGKAS
ncbi:MAG: phosphate acyltransferase PlsX [Bacteroidota bacterium]